MTDKLSFALVSPERELFNGDVDHVVVPGAEGEFGVLAGHAPFVAMLKPGILTIGGAQPKRIVVGGGLAEVGPSGLTVLAELAVPVEDFDKAKLAAEIRNAEEDAADAKDDAARQKASEKADHLKALQAALAH